MEKHFSLDQINNAILALTEAESQEQLYEKTVETAITLLDADMGKLVLYQNDKLKKVYYSDDRIKITSLISNKHFNKLLTAKRTFWLTAKELEKMQLKHFPHKAKFIVAIPLVHHQDILGVLLLFYLNEKKYITLGEQELLTLYGRTVVLALTKAILQDESQKALEIRDRFISLASHELRTPLTSIHGYIQLLHQRMKKEQTVESRWMKELYIESIRMTQLVKELLDVNRIKQGQFAFVFSEVTMLDVVKSALDRYRLTNSNHLFEFECKLDDHQTKVVGDFDKLVEMSSGLLDNAIKFSKPTEKILVTLNNREGAVTLEVKDQGKGISQQDLSAIFNGFYKSPTESYIEGMGVGLLVAKHIVDNHRGKLKIKSKIDKGTSVTVSLPALKAAKK